MRLRKIQLGLVLAAFLFVAAQFSSILYGLEFIASLTDNDIINDISLEEIVAMDPFLEGNRSDNADTLRIGISGNHTPHFSTSAFIVGHLQSCRFPEFDGGVTKLDLYYAVTRFPDDVWKTNRVLLI